MAELSLLSWAREIPPLYWNILLSATGGLTLATLARTIAPHARIYHHASKGILSRTPKELRQLESILADPIGQLESLEEDTFRAFEGEEIDIAARIQGRLEERAGNLSEKPFYRKEEHDPLSKVKYVVAYANTDISQKGIDARLIAAALAGQIRKQGKEVGLYAIGTDTIEVRAPYQRTAFSLQRQSGFNLYHALEDLSQRMGDDPTYFFCIMNANAIISDPSRKRSARNNTLISNKIVHTYIDIGTFDKEKAAYTNTIQAAYHNIDGKYGAIVANLPNILLESAQRMRSVTKQC